MDRMTNDFRGFDKNSSDDDSEMSEDDAEISEFSSDSGRYSRLLVT